jgi:hypothetical protein
MQQETFHKIQFPIHVGWVRHTTNPTENKFSFKTSTNALSSFAVGKLF